MNILQISDELYREIDSTDTSISKVAFWLRSRVGSLNTLINTAFTVDQSTLEYSPDLTPDEADILKELYYVYYFEKKFKDLMGASGVEVVEFREGDTVIRTTARTEFGKLYLTAKRDHSTLLSSLVDLYKRNRALARSVNYVGGDYPCPI